MAYSQNIKVMKVVQVAQAEIVIVDITAVPSDKSAPFLSKPMPGWARVPVTLTQGVTNKSALTPMPSHGFVVNSMLSFSVFRSIWSPPDFAAPWFPLPGDYFPNKSQKKLSCSC